MYNEFLFFYKKEPYKQFIWRYMGQTTAAKECAFSFCWGITNPPVLIGRTFFLRRIANHKWLKDYFRHVAL